MKTPESTPARVGEDAKDPLIPFLLYPVWGIKPISRRQWARRGARPRPLVVAAPRYQWLYLFGFVRPKTGQTEWRILPRVSTRAMNVAWAEFARVSGAGPGKQIILVPDGAGFHRAADLVVPAGLHLFELPACTPGLSPAEHLWPPRCARLWPKPRLQGLILLRYCGPRGVPG